MPCGYCGNDDCTPLNHYTEEDLFLSNPFISDDIKAEVLGECIRIEDVRPTEDHTNPLYQG